MKTTKGLMNYDNIFTLKMKIIGQPIRLNSHLKKGH